MANKPTVLGVGASGKLDARVDGKIAAAAPMLQPVLNHVRGAVHDTVPGVRETIKWGFAFFELDGKNLAHMGAFKNHCSFGFWSKSMVAAMADYGIAQKEGAGSFGKLTSIDDLPPYSTLCTLIRHAAGQIADGTWESPVAARAEARPEMPIPEDLAAALKTSAAASDHFNSFSPGCRREYVEWVTTAKRPETRARRIAEAVGMIAQGKQRNWKYVK